MVEEINAKLNLLKIHVPYHESDHVLNIAYNILAGGMRLVLMKMGIGRHRVEQEQ